MTKPWKILSSNRVLDTKYVTVHKDALELPNGHQIHDYYVFEFSDWARVVPITSDNQLILVEQYRHGVKQVTCEFPAGMIDPHERTALEAAKRELLEETGYGSDDWTPLGSFKLGPSRIKNGFHLFLARDCYPVSQQNLDAGEDIGIRFVSFSEFEELFENGHILDTDSALAWQLCKTKGLVKVQSALP